MMLSFLFNLIESEKPNSREIEFRRFCSINFPFHTNSDESMEQELTLTHDHNR